MLPQQENGYKRKLRAKIQDHIEGLYESPAESMEDYNHRHGYIQGLYAALELFDVYLKQQDENGDF